MASPDNDYTYDNLDRLTDIDYHDGTDEGFACDKLGNRSGEQNLREGMENYSVDSATNRYNNAGEDIVRQYDETGNMTGDPNYAYENRLIKITKGESDIAEYTYDALGRRIQVCDMVADNKTNYYYNDNWQVLKETDAEGYPLRSYIYGNYIDEVLVMIDPNVSEDFYYAHDHLYSPVALIDDEGDVLERYEYDAYGKPYFFEPNLALADTQASDYNNVILFTGRRVDFLDDGDLRLQYSRNRYYDYHTGRWMTQDLLAYIDFMNLYIYVGNNPIAKVDPLGLNPILDVIVARIENYLENGLEDMAAFEALKLYQTIADVGSILYPLPSALINHWLDGSGEPYKISSSHIRNAMKDTSSSSRKKSPHEQLRSIVCKWPADLKCSDGSLTDKPAHLEATEGNYFYAFGEFDLTFNGTYKCRDYKCGFKGLWDFSDVYKWIPGAKATIDGTVIKDDYALLVEKYYDAKPFEEYGTYYSAEAGFLCSDYK